MQSSADRIMDEAAQLRAEMSQFLGIWQECASHAMPLRALSLQSPGAGAPGVFKPDPRLHSDAAVDALNTLASGMVAWITPSQTNWFQWEPSESLRGNDAVSQWLADCTERAHRALAGSNFYHAVHLANLDLGCFGTAAVYAERGRGRALNFRTWQPGGFCCAENDQGIVDRVFRSFTLSAWQAQERFGTATPGRILEDVRANRGHTRHAFIHAVYPRPEDRERGGAGPQSMPYASCYVHESTRSLVLEEGFESLPVFVTRWLKWSDESPYGASPAMLSIADIKGLNFLEFMMATVADVRINPRIITKTGATGAIDLGPGGITQVRDMQDRPETWADPGDYRTGLDMIARKQEMIRRAFHVPLFEQFASLERQITAAEVRARQAEQLARVSPAFTLRTTDFINPVLERVFMLLFAGGYFLPPPPEAFVRDAAGQLRMLYPRTVQTSRMALAVQDLKESALAGTLETFAPLTGVAPDLFDNLRLDEAFRDVSRGKGLPAGYLRDVDERDAMRAARREQQQAQAAAEALARNPGLAAAAAGAAGMTGAAAPDSYA